MRKRPIGLKYCPGCDEEKPLTDFARDRTRKGGLMARCRACESTRNKRYYRVVRQAVLRKPPRPCEICGEPTPSARHHYCDACRRKKERERFANLTPAQRKRRLERERARERKGTTQRGYDTAHQNLRRRWAPKVARGDVSCARCAMRIPPEGEACPNCGKTTCGWDLGHDDNDRSRYSGPEHRCCNRATAGRQSRRR